MITVGSLHSEKGILDRKSKTKNMEKAILPQELGVLPLHKVMLEHTLKKLSKATQKKKCGCARKTIFHILSVGHG